MKYTPRGGNVVIGISHGAGHVAVEVSDTGPGLSEADQLRLWGKFQRLTPRPTEGESSSGLGLWIVRRLTESMGGTVFCHSILGRGSSFGIRLPIWNPVETAETVESDEMPASDLGGEEFRRIIAGLESRAALRREDAGVALPG